MSTRSPAAQLARLKVIYSRWRISRDDSTGMLTARERYGPRLLTGATPADLEHELLRAGWNE